MPSKDDILTHMYEPSAHLLRLKAIERATETEPGSAAAFIQGLPFSAIAGLHHEFHLLDEAERISHTDLADTSAEGK